MYLSRGTRKLQNNKAFPCHLASKKYVKELPKKFQDHSELLARIKVKALKEGELGQACRLIARLVSHESKNSGFDWKAKKVEVNFSEKSSIYYIVVFTTSCPELELESVVEENEKRFLEKYGIEIKFVLNHNLPKEQVSFLFQFIPAPL